MGSAVITDYGQLLPLMSKLSAESLPLKIDWSEANKRTLSANAQYHVWIKQIAEFMGDNIKTAENFCKLEFGLSIILARGDEQAKMIDYTLIKANFNAWSYEGKLAYMGILPVSRLMTTKEHCDYRDQIQRYYTEKGLYLDYL